MRIVGKRRAGPRAAASSSRPRRQGLGHRYVLVATATARASAKQLKRFRGRHLYRRGQLHAQGQGPRQGRQPPRKTGAAPHHGEAARGPSRAGARRPAAADGRRQRDARLVLRRRRADRPGARVARGARARRRRRRRSSTSAASPRVGGPPAGRGRTRRSRAWCRWSSASPPRTTCSSPSTPTSRRSPRPRSRRARGWSTTSPGCATHALADVCARTGAALVLMHTRVAPKGTLLDPDAYDDVVDDVVGVPARAHGGRAGGGRGGRPDRARPRARTSPRRRRRPSRCCGGSTRCAALGRPLLLAVSRKDFLGAITGRGAARARRGDARRARAGVDAGAQHPARPRRRRGRRLPRRARGAARRARARAGRRA